jgi:hypothetical protein
MMGLYALVGLRPTGAVIYMEPIGSQAMPTKPTIGGRSSIS